LTKNDEKELKIRKRMQILEKNYQKNVENNSKTEIWKTIQKRILENKIAFKNRR